MSLDRDADLTEKDPLVIKEMGEVFRNEEKKGRSWEGGNFLDKTIICGKLARVVLRNLERDCSVGGDAGILMKAHYYLAASAMGVANCKLYWDLFESVSKYCG